MKQKIKIYFSDEQELFRVTGALQKLLRRAIAETLAYEGFYNHCQVSVTFTDNEGIRALNAQYREIDRETDVLSFPLIDFEGGEAPPADEPEIILGDIVLSLEKTQAQAEEFGHSFDREAAFLCVHSMLHLLGYDHELSEEDDEDMRRRQREILERMGLSVK